MGSLQSQMKTIKEEIAKITATGSAGAGLVEATVNGATKAHLKCSLYQLSMMPTRM